MSTIAADAHASRPLSRQDVKTLSLSALGGALEFYDFIIFVFFTAALSKLFFPPDVSDWVRQLQTYGIFAAGYLARPLGGIVMAHFGDLVGRKRMFTFSIFLMAVPTFAMGLLPTYADIGIAAPVLLLLLRIIQGAAIGGEVPGAWVFVAEHVPPRHMGFACGTLTAGLTVGILLGSLMATFLNQTLSPQEVLDYGWRLAFVTGGVFGLLGVYLRRYLSETPVFEEMRQHRALARELPVKTVLLAHPGSVALSMLLTWMLTAAIVVVILMTPGILQSAYGFAPAAAFNANLLAVASLTVGCLFAGWAIDRYGAGTTFIAGSVLLAGCVWGFYTKIVADPSQLMTLYALAGLSVGIVGAVPYVMVKAFPPAVRFSGLSFSYNLAYAIFGGLTPVAVAALLGESALAPAYYVIATCGIGLVAGIYMKLTGFGRDTVERSAPGPT
ncbi:MFS transporter [Emcibacter sp. SYSU 3D8]|uniref:MFS transporter n=1 Tax=Emcibacter sp. SYSU 3D8 TaxID=3133969 RepID=UPI0031FF403D